MRVKDIMSVDVKTISPKESVILANEIMWRNRIHHLVVQEGKELVGILSDSDLGGEDADTIDDNLRVCDVMSDQVITIQPTETVKRAVDLMKAYAMHCLPVVENDKLVGIVTLNDIAMLEKRGTAQEPFQGLELHQGPYVPRQFRDERGQSKIHHTDWPGQ